MPDPTPPAHRTLVRIAWLASHIDLLLDQLEPLDPAAVVPQATAVEAIDLLDEARNLLSRQPRRGDVWRLPIAAPLSARAIVSALGWAHAVLTEFAGAQGYDRHDLSPLLLDGV